MSVYSAIALALAIQATPAAESPEEPQVVSMSTSEETPATGEPQIETGDSPLISDEETQAILEASTIYVQAPQALVLVRDAITPDTEFRTVDHGDIISSQTISPAQFVTITTPLNNANKYGPSGAVLWKLMDNDKEWWCYRNTARFPSWNFPTNFYCYRDEDGDGSFDLLRENRGWDENISHSRFLSTRLGDNERMRGKASYVAGGNLDYVEQLAVRYDGPVSGQVTADGIIIKGDIVFEVVAGIGSQAESRGSSLLISRLVDPTGMDKLFTLSVQLDENGKGSVQHTSGISIEVERANADGTVVMKLLSAIPVGETTLIPPAKQLDRETVLRLLREHIQR